MLLEYQIVHLKVVGILTAGALAFAYYLGVLAGRLNATFSAEDAFEFSWDTSNMISVTQPVGLDVSVAIGVWLRSTGGNQRGQESLYTC